MGFPRTSEQSHCGLTPGRLLLIALTAWALVMIMPALYREVETLASFGISADNDGVIRDVVSPFPAANQSPAALAGLQPGDRIDLQRMRCKAPGSRACANVVAVLGGFGGMQYTLPGRQVELAIIPAGQGPPHTLQLKAALAPLSWATRLVLLADTIVGVLFVATAFHLAWTQPSRLTWGFFLYAVWFNPGQTYAYYAFLQTWPVAVIVQQFAEAPAQGAAFAGLLAFALRFPMAAIDRRWQRVEAALPWVGVVIALLTLLSSANLFGFPTERIAVAMFLSGYLVNGATLLLLLVRRRSLPPQDQERMRWAIAGCAIGLPTFILAELCQSSGLLDTLWGISLPQPVIGLLYLPQGVIAYFVGTAVRRRRVVRVAIPLRHGTILAALTLALGVPVVYLHETAAAYHESLHLPEWIWPLVVGPIVLIVGQWLHEMAVELVDHAFSRRFHRVRKNLDQAAQAMLEAGSFADIDRLLVEQPVRSLRLSSAAVFRWTDGRLRRVEPAIGWDDGGLRELRSDLDALVMQCLTRRAAVRLPRGEWRRPGLPDDDQMPCLAVPVCGGAKDGIAVALFGPHETGSDIDGDERDMLQEFAARAGMGYDRVETELLRREVRTLQAQLTALQGLQRR